MLPKAKESLFFGLALFSSFIHKAHCFYVDKNQFIDVMFNG